jgi:periplasmic divalent cation tolerance protein
MPRIVQIITTVHDRQKAEEIGRSLVEEKLVACCQIAGPIRSIYWWKGSIEQADEWYCIMKTKEALYHAAQDAIRRLHPYEVPEIIGVPVRNALEDYAAWVEGETI